MPQARADDRRAARTFPNSTWTTRAFVQVDRPLKMRRTPSTLLTSIERPFNFLSGGRGGNSRAVLSGLAGARCEEFAESSRLLTEHLANYADRNTDFRGKAAYWAARDSERAGKLAKHARSIRVLQARYDANCTAIWPGSDWTP